MLNYYLILVAMMMQSITIYDFTNDKNKMEWKIVNDAVMGGRSQGTISVNSDGHGVFEGTISLENYGGFSLVSHNFTALNTMQQERFILKIKGDGKRYQLRVRTNQFDKHAYVAYFDTNGEWQSISIPFKSMHPTFRGKKLQMPNFPGNQMEEIGILIGNDKAENFKLIIDKIAIR